MSTYYSWMVLALFADLETKFIASIGFPQKMLHYNTHPTNIFRWIAVLLLTVLLAKFFTISKTRDMTLTLCGLGIYTGGTFGNFLSYIFGPVGVLDFIPTGNYIYNVADIMIFVGLIVMSVGLLRAVMKS